MRPHVPQHSAESDDGLDYTDVQFAFAFLPGSWLRSLRPRQR